MTRTSVRRAAALLEVAGVYLIGPLVGQKLRQALGIAVENPFAALRADISNAELLRASANLFVLLFFQYLGTFLVAIPLNWWYRRRGPAAYGVAKNGRTWKALLLAGFATAALANWPAATLSLVNYLSPSEMAPWRQAFLDMSWLRWQFWLFAGVASWALVPVLEELLYRGYFQRRLAEDWGNGPAIIGASFLFTFGHTQYQIPNLYNAGMIAALITMAVLYGIVFAWTGSIVPSTVAHAIINVPMTLRWQAAILGLFVIGIWMTWRKGASVLAETFQGSDKRICSVLGVAFGVYAAATARLDSAAIALAYVLPAVAIGLEAMDRSRPSKSLGI